MQIYSDNLRLEIQQGRIVTRHPNTHLPDMWMQGQHWADRLSQSICFDGVVIPAQCTATF